MRMVRIRPQIAGISLLVCLQLLGWGLFINKIYDAPASEETAQVATHCHGSGEERCQRQMHYQQLVQDSGVAATFTDLRAAYETDSSVQSDCHQLTHVIGRAAGEQFPTVSAAYAEGDEFCWSGYYHGVMESVLAQIEVDQVADQLNELCADLRNAEAYSFDHYNCVHGLGHGVMLITGHELFDALTNCDILQDSWERESCYGGVFMENIMASTNPDHATKYIKADQPLYPCTAVKDSYKQQCYLMQTSQALTSLNYDFAAVFSLCKDVEEPYRVTCYQSLGRDASGQSISDSTRTRQTCLLGSDFEAQSNCVVGAVKDFISYHHNDVQAKEFCSLLDQNLAAVCTQTARDYYQNFR